MNIPAKILLAIAETLAALAVVMVLIAVATAPFVIVWELEVALETSSENGPSISADELAQEIRDLELADEVGVLWRGGEDRLVIAGFDSADEVRETVGPRLEAAGYRSDRMKRVPAISTMEEVLKNRARTALSIQALVFITVALLLVRFRVGKGGLDGEALHGRALLLGVAGGLAAFFSSAAISLLLQRLGFPVQEQEWVRELLRDREQILKLAPWIVLIVPLSEEVFFRGYVLRFIADRFRFISDRAGIAGGLTISTGLFAVVHFNPSGFAIYLVIGLILGLVYVHSRSLVAPVAAHVVHNGAVLATALIASGQ